MYNLPQLQEGLTRSLIPSASSPTSGECLQAPVRIHIATSCPRPSRPHLGPQGLRGFFGFEPNGDLFIVRMFLQ